jgi:selenocysteine lyase/cysteine desulfurase
LDGKVEGLPNVKLHTSFHQAWGGAIGLVSVEGRKPGELDAYLMNKYKIHTTSIDWENIKGVRVTPNVYTTTKNLDVLVQGIREFAKS